MSAKETFQDYLDCICQYGSALKPKQYDSAAIKYCKSIKQSLKDIHWRASAVLPKLSKDSVAHALTVRAVGRTFALCLALKSVLNGTYHENDIQGPVCAKDEERGLWNHEIVTLKQGASFDEKAESKLDEIMRRLECLKHVPKLFLYAIDTATSLAIVEQIAEAITLSTEERKDRVYSPPIIERYCATARGSGWTDLTCHGVVCRPLHGNLEELCATAHSLILNKVKELNTSPDCKYRASAATCDDYTIIVDIRKEPCSRLQHTRTTLESPLPFIPGLSKARQVLEWVEPTRITAAEWTVDKGTVDKGTVDTDKGTVDTDKGTIEESLCGEEFETVAVEIEE